MFSSKLTEGKPESVQVSSDSIRAAIHEIRYNHGLDLHSFLMLRKGQLIWEEYFHDGMKDTPHVLHSISKSFTAMAIGFAQADGLLTTDDKVYDFFPEYKSLNDSSYKQELTIKHLLTMSSGFENRERELMFCLLEGNLTPAALSQRMIHAPGTTFDYYTIGTFLLSAIFHKVNPEGIHTYLRRKLFDPLGMGKSQWNVDNDGVPLGGTGLFLTSYDLARYGQFLLQQGAWKGKQLLPKEWVSIATSKQMDNSHNGGANWTCGYGYQFWMNAFGGFRADGMKGQYVIVHPDKQIVIVMTSHLDHMEIPLNAVSDIILPNCI